ncbi:hypothetical protein SAMN05421539_103125 [Jannaschia seohaensis]|uniref:Uncharacterized protein n=1 Tax=Jannaschia seohaensis TaxID=475081 RepID=A0A2Y9AIP2_9RHOB|nr:hypothetical protein BCF38_103125 [Jannaschia seohaensis]SSA44344.1 hypothetical protein SAMN05421539_103125 [Jannaschia seohaensis]
MQSISDDTHDVPGQGAMSDQDRSRADRGLRLLTPTRCDRRRPAHGGASSDAHHPLPTRERPMPSRFPALLTQSALAFGVLGCRPVKIRGIWQLERHRRVLINSEYGLSVYGGAGTPRMDRKALPPRDGRAPIAAGPGATVEQAAVTGALETATGEARRSRPTSGRPQEDVRPNRAIDAHDRGRRGASTARGGRRGRPPPGWPSTSAARRSPDRRQWHCHAPSPSPPHVALAPRAA